MNKPIRIKVSEKTQSGDLFIYKEGKGMCQSDVVHLEQLGFADEHHIISFEISKIPKIIEALQKLPILTEKNEKSFMKEMSLYFLDNDSDCGFTREYFDED